ncbi:hypothetical protein BJ170DRAFT_597816 [Xylariales sp. AK1849]|nr:hypothetical protein BJ170DRAFT_597816 [Xylariales sp. AK1849]
MASVLKQLQLNLPDAVVRLWKVMLAGWSPRDFAARREVVHALKARSTTKRCKTPHGAVHSGNTISSAVQLDAVNEGWSLLATNQVVWTAQYTASYPHWYNNYENIPDIAQNCPGALNPGGAGLYLFPVYWTGTLFGYGQGRTQYPSTDRVVFDGCGNWCATITHRGEANNGFHQCNDA